MLMTTNTLWIPVSSENLPGLANWTEIDFQLLTDLVPYAAAVAPPFREAIFARLSKNLLYVSPIEYELGKSALEKWFIHLFHNAETIKTLHPCQEDQTVGLKTPHRKSGIPFRYMLSLQEVILKYGKRVTQNSHEPEQAYSAFQKILGLEFAINQLHEEMYISHLSELLLDD